MPFAYYQRLNTNRQRIYGRSDAVHQVPLPADVRLEPTALRIRPHFAGNARRAGILQRLLGAHWGELHGLYEPREGAPARISVWMRTARQKRVVAFRSFLRTLLHELCHHLDYELFRLPETFHTEGFYKRESHLLHQVLGEAEGKEEDR